MIRPRGIVLSIMTAAVAASTVGVRADETPADDSAIHEAVERSVEAFIKAFNEQDAEAVADLWTPDGEYVDEFGQRYVGREAIAREYAAFFDANPGVKVNLSIDAVRRLGPTTAIEDGHASLSPPPAGAPGLARYTAVHVKHDGQWKMASVRDARIEIKSTYGRLHDLEWMVGDWTASHAGVTAELRCRWIAHKSYLQLCCTVTRDGHELSNSTEVIGWDSLEGQIQSWTFSSGGGRAVGVWKPGDDGWFVDSTGVTAEGVTSKTVAVWTRLEGDALGWKSTASSFGGIALDDASEVIFKRK